MVPRACLQGNPEYTGRLRHYQARLIDGSRALAALLGRLPDRAPQNFDKRVAIVGLELPYARRRLTDLLEHDGGVAFERRSAALTCFREPRLERLNEPLGRQRRRPVIVDESLCGGLVGRRERGRRVDDILVDERLEHRRLVLQQQRRREQKQLRLPLVQVTHRIDEQGDVALFLPYEGGWGMLAGRREIDAVRRTGDFGETLRAAAHRTDPLSDGGTVAPRLPLATQWAGHSGHYCTIPAEIPENSSERGLHSVSAESGSRA